MLPSGPSNAFLSHRIFHSLPEPPKTSRLFEFQRNVLLSNQYTIDLQSLKSSGVANSTSKFLEGYHRPTTLAAPNTISVLNAAAHAQSKKGQSDLKVILP